MKRHRIALKIKLLAYSLLNKFCFSKRHDDFCNGCAFKNFRKCPVTQIGILMFEKETLK